MKSLKRISIFLIAFILFTTNVYANIAIINTNKVEVKITGIYDEIDKIELYKYGKTVDIDKVFDGTLDISKANSVLGNTVYYKDDVDPFSKENYVENKNYDNKKYRVTVNYSYTYIFTDEEKDTELEYTFNKKYADIQELKEGIRKKEYGPSGCTNVDFDIDDYKSIEKFIDSNKLTCTRDISYTVIMYEYVKDISTNLIKDNNMEFSLNDFPKAEEGSRETISYMIRFFPKNSGSNDFLIGNDEIIQDAHIQTKPTIKYVNIEYSHNYVGEVKHQERTITKSLSDNIIKIIIAIVLTIVVEVVIALIMKIKHLGIISGTNLITQLILHCVTILLITNLTSIPIYYYIIAELLIVLIEFGIYALLMKDISKKKLILYSVIANIITFGLSFLVNLIGK